MKTIKKYPSQAELKELFDYNPDIGNLLWKIKPAWRVSIGDIAGLVRQCGDIDIRIHRVLYKAHRLIWIWNNGDIPDGYIIDHINEIRNDNRLSNLRLTPRYIWFDDNLYHCRINLTDTRLFIGSNVDLQKTVLLRDSALQYIELLESDDSDNSPEALLVQVMSGVPIGDYTFVKNGLTRILDYHNAQACHDIEDTLARGFMI